MAENPGTKKFSPQQSVPSTTESRRDLEEKTDPNFVLPAEMRAPTQTTNPSIPRPAPSTAQRRPQTVVPPPPAIADPEMPPEASANDPTPTIRMPELGPLDALMKDPSITEIMVNDLRNVMIEKGGRLIYAGFGFKTIEELNRITRNILDMTGRILSPDQPYVDVMLPDGSRVNIVAPPLTLVGPCLTIRKFPTRRMMANDLMATGMMDQRMAYFLNACVLGKLNILIAGGTGTGKTTLLNVLTSFIPKKERVVSIEDTPELALHHVNSVRMQTKPRTPASEAISARELLSNALRMRPDRIIVGECRKAEAFDMLQAMNTGHSGSMTTIHANTPRDALARTETLCMLAGMEIPIQAIRKQIASALDLIVQIKRFRDGKRRIVAISEITGMEAETFTLQDIFLFQLNLEDSQNSDAGHFQVTGLVPTFLDRLREQGVELPRNYFAG